MKKQKITYNFHNPNVINERYLDRVLSIFIEANMGKVERAILAAAEKERQTQDELLLSSPNTNALVG